MKKRIILFLVIASILFVSLVAVGFWLWNPLAKLATATFCPYGIEHEYRTETIPENCTQAGYTTVTCQKCGYNYTCDMVNALGHQWEELVTVKPLTCIEDGLQSMSCSSCGVTQEIPVNHSGHNYMAVSTEGDDETVDYICTVCNDYITRDWDDVSFSELKERQFLPDCTEDFTFLVSCEQGEDYLYENLTLKGESGSIPYKVSEEEEGVYRITATKPYTQYLTYYAQGLDDIIFPEYHAKSLEFTIAGPERINVEFNEKNLIFLKKMELKQYKTSGLYDLQWDEVAQRYYLTLYKLKSINSSMIGKVIAVGDYTSTDEILEDGTRELHFGKLERISHTETGELLLVLSPPELSEVYKEFDIYFTNNSGESAVIGDPEAAFMNAIVNSDGFAEYLTAVHLAADSYAQDHGLVVIPLSETSSNSLKFELTENYFEPVPGMNMCLLKLGGQITYTVPLKSQSGHASGSIVMTCTANITSNISAGGQFKDKDSVNLYLLNSTTTTLGFVMDFNLQYSYEHEVVYLMHNTTHKIHTSTCRIAKKETSSSNLRRLTAQELSDMFNGDKDAMKQNECKVCKSITGLDATAYVYNPSTGVLHCMDCLHVSNMSTYNICTLYPDNTFQFTECADCRPQDRQSKDFDNRMLNAIQGSDWAEQVNDLRNVLGDSIGNKKAAPQTEPGLSAPINIAGVFNIQIGVAPVLDFDMKASVNFVITSTTTNKYGIRSVGEGFETYNIETPGDVDYELKFTGEADAKFGIELFISAYPVGCEDFAYITISGQVGVYGHFTGIISTSGTLGGDNDTFCAARLAVGLYIRMDGYWKILWFDDSFVILEEQRIQLFKWGYDRVYYAFEEEEIELVQDDPDDFAYLNLSYLMDAQYLDLTTMKYGTDQISPISKSMFTASVDIQNEDGTPCDFLGYNADHGIIYKLDHAPRTFTAIVIVKITPRVQINNLADFKASESDKALYGYTMDSLVITLKVEENSNPYQEILDMYYTSISNQWENCDDAGYDVVGDPDNACYIFSRYERNRPLDEVGYALLDISNDGVPELFISMIDMADSGSFYDMYSVVNGEVVHVITAAERDRYSYAMGNSINNSSSGSAFSGVFANYGYDSTRGALKVNHYVEYDDTISPYGSYTTTGYRNQETYSIDGAAFQSVTKDQVWALYDSFPSDAALALIPFAAYGSDDTAQGADVLTAQDLVGDWILDPDFTMATNSQSMTAIYGSIINDSKPQMTFHADGSFEYYVSWCYGSGSYDLQGDTLFLTVDEGEPAKDLTATIFTADGEQYIALDQFGDGTLVFWSRADESASSAYASFCKTLPKTYTASDGSTAKLQSCAIADFDGISSHLVVRYCNPTAYDAPGEFFEVWIVYGTVSGEIMEVMREENFAPTRRNIYLGYHENYGYALIEEQAFAGYYDLFIHYPDKANDVLVESYSAMMLSDNGDILRIWIDGTNPIDIAY